MAGKPDADELVTHLAFSPHSKHLVAGYADGDLRVWGTDTRQLVARFHGHERRGHRLNVAELCFSPDGRTLACSGQSSDDGMALVSELGLYDIAGRRELPQLLRSEGVELHGLAFSPDGSMLAVACFDTTKEEGSIRIWSMPTGEAREIPGGKALRDADSLVFSHDMKLLAVGHGESFSLWDWRTARKRADLPLLGSWKNRSSARLAFSRDGRAIATVGYRLALWELSGFTSGDP
jgi:WD40 repeat protein